MKVFEPMDEFSDAQTWAVLTAVTAAAALVVWAAALRKKNSQKLQREGSGLWTPPSTLPVLGNTLDLVQNALHIHDWTTEQCRASGGRPVVVRVVGQPPTVVVSTPEHYEEIARTRFEAFGKGPFQHDLLRDLMGESIFTVDGDEWKFHRRIMVGLFSQRALRGPMTQTIQKHVRTFELNLSGYKADFKPVNLFRELHRFTLGTFSEIALGVNMRKLPSDERSKFEEAFSFVQHRVGARYLMPTPAWHLLRYLNLGAERKFSESMQVINSLVLRLIRESMDRPRGNGKDLVSLILDHVDSEKHSIEANTVRDMVVTALVAGRDTTADSMSWFFHMLSGHPRVEQEIRAELHERIPQLFSDPEFVPAMDDVAKLPYLEASIRELLRLYPPAAYMIRHCFEDTVLDDGTFVGKDWMVGLPLYAMGRQTRIWGEDALEFKPERFLDQDELANGVKKLGTQLASKFLAFHAGPRLCVGRDLAMLQMKILISTVVSRFHVEELPGLEVTYMPSVTLPMKNPLLMRVTRV
jgi:cytochrome P450